MFVGVTCARCRGGTQVHRRGKARARWPACRCSKPAVSERALQDPRELVIVKEPCINRVPSLFMHFAKFDNHVMSPSRQLEHLLSGSGSKLRRPDRQVNATCVIISIPKRAQMSRRACPTLKRVYKTPDGVESAPEHHRYGPYGWGTYAEVSTSAARFVALL